MPGCHGYRMVFRRWRPSSMISQDDADPSGNCGEPGLERRGRVGDLAEVVRVQERLELVRGDAIAAEEICVMADAVLTGEGAAVLSPPGLDQVVGEERGARGRSSGRLRFVESGEWPADRRLPPGHEDHRRAPLAFVLPARRCRADEEPPSPRLDDRPQSASLVGLGVIGHDELAMQILPTAVRIRLVLEADALDARPGLRVAGFHGHDRRRLELQVADLCDLFLADPERSPARGDGRLRSSARSRTHIRRAAGAEWLVHPRRSRRRRPARSIVRSLMARTVASRAGGSYPHIGR